MAGIISLPSVAAPRASDLAAVSLFPLHLYLYYLYLYLICWPISIYLSLSPSLQLSSRCGHNCILFHISTIAAFVCSCLH